MLGYLTRLTILVVGHACRVSFMCDRALLIDARDVLVRDKFLGYMDSLAESNFERVDSKLSNSTYCILVCGHSDAFISFVPNLYLDVYNWLLVSRS